MLGRSHFLIFIQTAIEQGKTAVETLKELNEPEEDDGDDTEQHD